MEAAFDSGHRGSRVRNWLIVVAVRTVGCPLGDTAVGRLAEVRGHRRQSPERAAAQALQVKLAGTPTATRWVSIQNAQNTSSHWACPTQAIAAVLGGGGPVRFAA
jgi:hypothetical protein